ncbi:TPA: hypothetical protein ACXJUU_004673 [Serratia marcescens]
MQLEDYISAERLKIYTDVLKLKPGEEQGGYNWNKALCSAMQPLLHCLEVTLRMQVTPWPITLTRPHLKTHAGPCLNTKAHSRLPSDVASPLPT